MHAQLERLLVRNRVWRCGQWPLMRQSNQHRHAKRRGKARAVASWHGGRDDIHVHRQCSCQPESARRSRPPVGRTKCNAMLVAGRWLRLGRPSRARAPKRDGDLERTNHVICRASEHDGGIPAAGCAWVVVAGRRDAAVTGRDDFILGMI